MPPAELPGQTPARTRAGAIVVVIALLTATPAPARAGGAAVKGTITAGPPPGTPVADAVVMVDGPAPPAPAPGGHAVVDQRSQTFVPHVLAVPVGTMVDFPNHDPVLHNVFSASPAKRFDLGMYDQGETRSVTFDRPGVVEIRCNAHPRMRAFVVVQMNPYAAVSDAHGAYTITGIPPGVHRVRVWHESLAEGQSPITLHEGQVETLDVRLEKRP